MKTVRTIAAVRRHVQRWRNQGQRTGFVPTMGALHVGHERLIQRAGTLCDRTVVSIFVNPAQFGRGEDLAAYPRPLQDDLKVCRRLGVDLVFVPEVKTVYPDSFATSVHVGPLGDLWEGASRPGHFDGVATVVLKLFNIVGPDVAVFGQKDYQQLQIVRQLGRDFNLPIRIVGVPTVRERGGLAVSSRNIYLSESQRNSARMLYEALRWARMEFGRATPQRSRIRAKIQRMIEQSGDFSLDYVGFCDRDSLQELTRPRSHFVILIAATCRTSGLAQGRRYIDNILVP